MGARSIPLIRSVCGCMAAALVLLWVVGPYFLNAAWTPTPFSSVLLTNGRIEIAFSDGTLADIMATPIRNGRERLSVGYDDVYDSTRPVVDANGQPVRAALIWFPASGSWSLWPGNQRSFSKATYRVPYWCIAVPFAFVAYGLERHRRQLEREGKCRKCGYSRAGLSVGAKCPECGGD